MAPYYVPEEVDVFSVPHSRMKQLVNSYFTLVRSTNFSSTVDLQLLLDSLYRTFSEFKSHEQIENKLIMRKLRSKLRTNEAVCKCHKESRLTEMTDMLQLFQDGLNKSTVQDRINYGLQLTKELEEFTSSFLPHMQEEEEVFQPLLLEYFSYDELCQLRLQVIELHQKRQEQEKFTWTECEKECSFSSSESDEEHTVTDAVDTSVNVGKTVQCLPSELLLNIFGRLSVRDICRCAQVCRLWNHVTREKVLWTAILPTQWAQDAAAADCEVYSLVCDIAVRTADADADVDETAVSVSVSCSPLSLYQRECQILSGCIDSLLPSVGNFVQKIVVSNSLVLGDTMLTDLLALCSNVEYLDVSYCNISDKGLLSVNTSHLTTLIVAGCENVTDVFLLRCFVPDMPMDLNLSSTAADCAVQKPPCTASSCHMVNSCNVSGKQSFCHKLNQREESSSAFRHACTSVVTSKELSSSVALNSTQMCSIDRSGHCADAAEPLAFSAAAAVEVVGDEEEECHQSTVSCGKASQSAAYCYRRTCDNDKWTAVSYKLEHLDMSGCWKVSDLSIRALSQNASFPKLCHLDMSGCFRLTGDALKSLVSVCPVLRPSSLYYCDNITDGPFPNEASGCRNLECSQRICCRSGD